MPSPYVKVHEDWEDLPSTDTPVTAAALEQIETGIADAQTTADAANSAATDAAADLATHLADTSDAHDASAVSTVGSYGNVQQYLEGLEAEITSGAGYFPGGTDVAITDGGTGASTAANARTNLGLAIGSDVQAYDAELAALAGLSPSNDDVLQRKAGAWTNRTIAQLLTDLGLGALYQPLDSDLTALAALTTTSFGRALLEVANAGALRTAAGLGTAATADTGTGAGNVPTITQADARYAVQSQNLSDIDDAATARGNLGILPTSATRAYLSSANQSLANATVTLINLNTESFDDDGAHFTSAANLTGTVSKTASSTTLTGSGTAFSTELSVGQIISVPGTAAEIRVVTAIASNTSLTVNATFVNTASGQTASRQNHGIVALEAGRYRADGGIEFAVNTAGDRLAGIYLNAGALTSPTGTRIAVADNEASGGLADRFTLSTGVVSLAQWDYVSLAGYQNSTGALDVTLGEYVTWLCLERVG